jgi:hypothetical protein
MVPLLYRLFFENLGVVGFKASLETWATLFRGKVNNGGNGAI